MMKNNCGLITEKCLYYILYNIYLGDLAFISFLKREAADKCVYLLFSIIDLE